MTVKVEEMLGQVADRLNVAVESLGTLEKRLSSKSAMDTFHWDGQRALSFMTGRSQGIGGVTVEKGGYTRLNQLRAETMETLQHYEPKFKSATEFLSLMATDRGEFLKRYNASVESLGPRAKALGMNTLNGDTGGALVLPEFAPSILTREWANDLWERCDTYTVAGNRMDFPKIGRTDRRSGAGKRNGGLVAYYRGEGNSATLSSIKVESTSLKLNDLCIAIFVTQEMLSDMSYTLERFIAKKVAEELNFQRGLAVMRGDGDGKPLGILNSNALVTASPVSGQGLTITAKNVVDMWSRRIGNEDARSNRVWLINQEAEPQLHLLNVPVGTAGGQVVYMPPGGLSASPYATLMGRPVMVSEFCSALGDPGDIVLADFQHYYGIEKGGVIEETSSHVEFLKREMCFLFTVRFDGRPIDDAPITPYLGSATQSAFVTLGQRTA